MSRQQFRLLVVAHQLLIFGGLVVYEMTARALPPDLAQYVDVGRSVVEDEGGGWLRSFDDWLYYALTAASLVGSLGMCLFKKWGRTLFLLCTLVWLFTSPVSEFYVQTGWSSMVGYAATLLEGMIIALAYFSHVRRLFARAEAA
jgi:hypothetical protein